MEEIEDTREENVKLLDVDEMWEMVADALPNDLWMFVQDEMDRDRRLNKNIREASLKLIRKYQEALARIALGDPNSIEIAKEALGSLRLEC